MLCFSNKSEWQRKLKQNNVAASLETPPHFLMQKLQGSFTGTHTELSAYVEGKDKWETHTLRSSLRKDVRPICTVQLCNGFTASSRRYILNINCTTVWMVWQYLTHCRQCLHIQIRLLEENIIHLGEKSEARPIFCLLYISDLFLTYSTLTWASISIKKQIIFFQM